MNPVVALGTAAVAVAVGALVLLRASQPRIGWLLVLHGLCFGALLAFDAPGTGPAGLVVDQLVAGSWVLLFLWLALLAYLLPDGTVLSPAWGRWVRVGLLGVVAFLVGAAGDAPAFREAHGGAGPPLAWLPAPLSAVLGGVGLVLTVALLGGAVVAVRSRLRRATGEERLRLLWPVWGATSLPAALVLAWVGHFLADDDPRVVGSALTLAGTALPVSIGVAMLRHRLFDVRIALSRTLTYGTLVLLVVAVYGLLLLGAQRLGGDSGWGGLVAVGVVALAVHPAYGALRRRIEVWVYGYRADPTAALRRLGASVEEADPLGVVEGITGSVADALRVDRAWVEDGGRGADPGVLRVPLVHRGTDLGTLAVAVPPGRALSAADTALLRDLARQAAATLHAARLATELQASRLRIVTLREEERKRIRRDLHDGLGPSLAAILLTVDAARSREDPEERAALLAEVRDETRAAIVEVRRVVDDLRPAAIDEVGLAGAIRQRAATLSSDTLAIRVEAPETLPSLPAAVEVAAFRIASEAMTNAARHSAATRCTVELALDGTLGITVSDNGLGADPTLRPGVGWSSMAERAAELGGSCTVSRRAAGGLTVRAMIPLPSAVGAEVTR